MRIYDAAFAASLAAAVKDGIAPVFFFWIEAKDTATGDPVPVGLWSGNEPVTVTVELPDGTTESRSYEGGVGLEIDGLVQVADLTDNPVDVTFSQIAPVAQDLVRGTDIRLAYCEVHVTTMNGGVFTANPQLEFVGIVDEGPIPTPAAGGEGGVSITLRDEIISQLTAINPAKSSDAHQRRRLATDGFCKWASTVSQRTLQWFNG